jgi:dihydroneopterin aldolase
MSRISIIDLEVFYRVGVTEEERANPQRLLLTIDLDFDFSSAAISDRVNRTIDYAEVCQTVLRLGERRTWKLIETIATDIANKVLVEFRPERVAVEVKKFPFPQARHVSVSILKEQSLEQPVKRPWWAWYPW